MGNKRSNCIKRKKAGVFFSLKLYRNLSLPRKINMICSSSLSIYCFYVYRVKGDRCSISFIKYLWTLFSSYRFKYELLFVWVRGHMRPLHIPPLINDIYRNTKGTCIIGMASFFSTAPVNFPRKWVVS